MLSVVVVRLMAAVPLLLGVSLLSFLLLHLAPGRFVDRFVLDPSIPTATIDSLVAQYGLDRPWYEQYGAWLGGVLQGDLGHSLIFRRPVGQLVSEAALYTLALAATAMILSAVVGLGLGLISIRRVGGLLDRIVAISTLALGSIPTLVLALGALGIAAATGVFPVGGGSSLASSGLDGSSKALDFGRHLFLPALALSLSMLPPMLLQARGALMDVLPSPPVRAARARGLSEKDVLVGHVLRLALVPFIAYVGSSVARLLNGAFLVEVVIGWPGIGRLGLEALLARDAFLVLGVLLSASVLVWLGHLVSDLAVAVADPRVRLEVEAA